MAAILAAARSAARRAAVRAPAVAASAHALTPRLAASGRSWKPVPAAARAGGRRHQSSGNFGPSGLFNALNGLILLNVGSFAWFYLDDSRENVRRFNRFMVLSESRVQRTVAPLLGHMFAHADLMHLAFNMMTLQSFGSNLYGWIMRPRSFMALYFASGLVGGLSHLAYCRWAPFAGIPASSHVSPNTPAVGASGAVTGIVMYSCALFPRSQIQFFFIPVPNTVYMTLWLGFSLYCCYSGDLHGFAHAAHLGGAAVGLAAAAVRRARWRLR